jgi:deoxyribose-phosphate aldolase
MNINVEKIEEIKNSLPKHVQKKFDWQETSDFEELKPDSYASLIDHTLLKADVTTEQIEKLCHEALEHGFFSVCIAPCHIPVAEKILKNKKTKICSVIGFPLGNQTSATKTFEARNAIELGADEIDMVINISAIKSKKLDLVFQEIETIKQVCGSKVLKVILETCYLNNDEILSACMIAKAAGADFVKTSTGFGTDGATVEHIELMRKVVGADMGVKASGGIRSKEDAEKMLRAGASRLGCSAGLKIVGATKTAPEGNY